MSNYNGLGDLVEQIKETSRNIELSDGTFAKRLDGIEQSVNDCIGAMGDRARSGTAIPTSAIGR